MSYLRNRKRTEAISLIIAVVALITSIVATSISVSLTKTINSSDYQSTQNVKKNTTELLSTLRSIINKGTLHGFGYSNINMNREKEEIENFLNSSTGFAYHIWVTEKSKQVAKEGKDSERWRLLFFHLIRLTASENPKQSSVVAANVQYLFEELREDDFETISDYLKDIPKAIIKLRENIEYDIIPSFIEEIYVEKQNKKGEFFEEKLRFLKDQGINDPDLDLWIAIIEGDKGACGNALDRGANVHSGDKELLNKYEEQLNDFEITQNTK
jgi:hypothetical protein